MCVYTNLVTSTNSCSAYHSQSVEAAEMFCG